MRLQAGHSGQMTCLGFRSRTEGNNRAEVSINHSSSKHPCSARLPAAAAQHPGLQPRVDWHGVQRCRTAEHPWLLWALLSKCQRFSVEGHLSYEWWLPGTQSLSWSSWQLVTLHTQSQAVHIVSRKVQVEFCADWRLRDSPRPGSRTLPSSPSPTV